MKLGGNEYDNYDEIGDDEIVYDEIGDDQIPKTKKAKDLEKKINDLYNEIEKEESLFKRHINQFKIRGLIAKLQREIDRQNIKQEYAIKRNRLANQKGREEDDIVDNIPEIQKDIRCLENKLKGNAEYDYKSGKFMYPKDYVEKAGGIDKFTEKLKTKDSETTQNAAKKIEEMLEIRRQLTEKQEELKAEQAKLANLDTDYKKKTNKMAIEEKSLILVKNNPLDRLKGLFSNAVTEIKAFWADRQDYKKLKAEEKNAVKELEEGYKLLMKKHKEDAKKIRNMQETEMKKNKLREFQKNAGIKVSEDQLIEDGNSLEQQPEQENDLHRRTDGNEPGDE